MVLPVIRAFIAIDLTPEIQERLDQVSGQLKERLKDTPIRWVPVENIHLTLKFLGNVSTTNLDMLTGIIQTVSSGYQPFEISIGGLGAYPKLHRPRVIWIGIEAPQDLVMTQRSLETETARLGYAREDRPFSPHLTLGRVSRNASSRDIRATAEELAAFKVGFLGVVRVQSVHLYQSDLKPTGAVYKRLFSATLGE
jgi:2'-5' RNA ligase